MNKYEIMYITRPDLEDAARIETMEKIHAILGEVTNVNEWGLKELAYEIKNFKKGYYVVVEANATAEQVKEFDRIVKIDANIVRHMTIRKEVK